MQRETPGKRPFYKYASPETTLAVLRNRTVRYSSPLAFNDPFDVQSGLHLDFDMDTLHRKIIDRIEKLASAVSAPSVDPDDVWGSIVLEARKYYPTNGFDKERWLQMTAEPFGTLLGEIESTQQKYQSHWRNKLFPGVKVFCVSEDRDNLLMWAHYAQDHKGAVFELWSLPEDDNPLSVARAVEYQDNPPPFFSEAEWIDDLTGVKKLDLNAFYRRYAYIKSKHWSYEREWRVWYPGSNEAALHDNITLRHSEFASLYFGCRAEPSFVNEALGLVRSSFQNVQVYKGRKKEHAYAIEYKEI